MVALGNSDILGISIIRATGLPGREIQARAPSYSGDYLCSGVAAHMGFLWPSDPSSGEGRGWLQCGELLPAL